jgi:hypothetical protein
MKSLAGMSALAGIGFLTLSLFPYRDAPAWEMKGDGGKVFPQLAGIWTSEDGLQKLEELKSLIARHGKDFEVLPAHPAAHYLSQTQPMLRVDWAHDAEMAPAMLQANIALLDQATFPVFVEKSRFGEANSQDPHYKSSLLAKVLQDFITVDSTAHYWVYRIMQAPESQIKRSPN